jgi:pyrroline-5-carboxylate reductase
VSFCFNLTKLIKLAPFTMLRTLSRSFLRSQSSVFARGASVAAFERLYSSSIPALEGVFNKIACVGTGKMAQAMLEPLVKQGVQPSDQITIYDVNPSVMEDVASKYGLKTAPSIPELVKGADLIMLCVKPQNLTEGFWNEMHKGGIDHDTIALSIIAGKSISIFENAGFEKVVRSMPNTPAMIGEGMTVWSCTTNLTADERKCVREILSSCGKSVSQTLFNGWWRRTDVQGTGSTVSLCTFSHHATS